MDDHERELEFHLQMEVEDNIARGMTCDEARRAAKVKLGNRTALREEVYRMNHIAVYEALIWNVRYAVRALRKAPTFTLVSLTTLALAIGATTAVVTIVNSVILRPLPYFEPEKLVTLWESNAAYHLPGCPSGTFRFSPGDYLYLRDHSRSFESIGGVAFEPFTLTGSAGPDRVMGGLASAGAFAALGVRPAAGRLFAHSDDSPSAERVVILGHSLWIERFGGSPTAIGSTLRLEDHLHTIVGVMPAGFRLFNQEADVWVPMERKLVPQDMRWHYSYYVDVIARLKAGVSIDQAREDADQMVRGVVRDFPGGIATGGAVVPLLDNTIAGVRRPLLLFLGAVGFVLLIACANVANLHLARGISRRKEIALRLALGAGRARVITELFTESMILAMAGSAAGIGLAEYGVRTLLRVASDEIPRAAEVHIDAKTLAFTILASTLSAILFGLWPAVVSLASDPQKGIRASANQARTGLIVGEIALALVLTIGASLMIESFRRVSAVDPGFDPRGLITMRVALSENRYDTTEKQNAFYRTMIEALRAMPEMKAASAIDGLPFTGGGFDNTFTIDGQPTIAGKPLQADIRRVDREYFRTMAIAIVEGRALNDDDRADSPPVAVINANMARKYWPKGSAIGKRLTVLFGPPGGIHAEIVGVAADVRSALDSEPNDFIYLPYPQGFHIAQMDLALRPRERTASVAAMAGAVRNLTRKIDPDQPVYQVRGMAELVSASLATRNFEMTVLGIFAALAVALAWVGLYGVLAYSVQARTKEIGIRMALGATQARICAMVLVQALKLAAAGLAIGVAGAGALTGVLAGLLFGVRPTDGATFVVVSLALLCAAGLAGYIPAKRAACMDPMVALRDE